MAYYFKEIASRNCISNEIGISVSVMGSNVLYFPKGIVHTLCNTNTFLFSYCLMSNKYCLDHVSIC